MTRWEGSELGSHTSTGQPLWKPYDWTIVSRWISCDWGVLYQVFHPLTTSVSFPCFYLCSSFQCWTSFHVVDFLGLQYFFPFVLLSGCSFTTAVYHSFHRFLLVPFSATAIRQQPCVFHPHLSKKKRYSVNLLSWLHGLNCLPTFEWQQMVTSFILFAIRKEKELSWY